MEKLRYLPVDRDYRASDETLQTLQDTGLPFDIFAFADMGLCMQRCRDDNDCRDEYECAIPPVYAYSDQLGGDHLSLNTFVPTNDATGTPADPGHASMEVSGSTTPVLIIP